MKRAEGDNVAKQDIITITAQNSLKLVYQGARKYDKEENLEESLEV